MTHLNQSHRWYALRTWPRYDIILRRQLHEMSLISLAPTTDEARVYAGQSVRVNVPVFPGFVFVHATVDDLAVVRGMQHVREILDIPDQDEFGWALENLSAAALISSVRHRPTLEDGHRARVSEGPLVGLQGWIAGVENANEMIFQIRSLGVATSVPVRSEYLQLL